MYVCNKKAVWLFITAISAAALLHLISGKKEDPLAEYKKQVTVQVPAEAKQTLDRAIICIKNNNMNALFNLMAHKNHLDFNENYVKGLFAEKDFYPCKMTGDPAVKFAKSTKEHVIVKIYSEKRKQYYLMSLQKVKNTYKIYSIMQEIHLG